MSMVTFDGATGYLVRAKTQRAGVVLLPTIYGVNPFVRDIAAALATDGITTLIWDIYEGAALPAGFDEARRRAGLLRDGPALAAMRKCVDYLANEIGVASVGTLGFCLGGRYCFILGARERRLTACVSVYPSIHTANEGGQTEDAVTLAAEIACPVQVIYPGRDQITSRATFDRLQHNLQSRPAAATVIQLHPLAEHGFMHNEAPENLAADRRARPLIAPFLNACLA